MGWLKEYRESILFIWGISLLTFIIVFHIVADSLAYVILGAAVGLPLAVGGFTSAKKKDESSNGSS